MIKKILLMLSSLTLITACTGKKSVTRNENICEDCNVVLISSDCIRADHMSLYGYSRDTTPALKEFGSKAIVFENYISTAALTPIAEASVHTGLYPENNGLISFQSQINPTKKTLTQHLAYKGYQTAAFIASPEFFSRSYLRDSFGKGFSIYNTQPRYLPHRREVPMDAIKDWLVGAKKKDKPFFLWVASSMAHWPFGVHTPNRFADEKYSGILKGLSDIKSGPYQHEFFQYIQDGHLYKRKLDTMMMGNRIGNFDFQKPGDHDWPANPPKGLDKIKLNPADFTFVADLYDNGVRAADDEFANVLKILNELDLTKKTVIIFQSEHGEDLNEHGGSINHDDIHSTNTHVPLVFYSPKIRPMRESQVMSGVDLMPTILDHLGIEVPAKLDGQSYFQTKSNPSVKARGYAFISRTPLWLTLWNTLDKDHTGYFDDFRKLNEKFLFKDYGLRTAEWKLIHRKSRFVNAEYTMKKFITGSDVLPEEYELYDVKKDPIELNNVADKYPEVLAELKAIMDKQEKSINQTRVKDKFHPEFQQYF